ncbi:MAG: hypothetical protein AAF961_14650, partial [Planctomycetota bacterium]
MSYATNMQVKRNVLHVARLTFVLALAALPARAEFAVWEVTGQVNFVFDLTDTLAELDVRVGDPIRGRFYYDLSLEGLPDPELESALALLDAPLAGELMVIENPRNGNELIFGVPQGRTGEFAPALVEFGNDRFDEEFGESVDEAFMLFGAETSFAGALPESSFAGDEDLAVVVVELTGPDGLEEASIPSEVSLDDWPLAEMWVTFLAWEDQFFEIVADLFSITRVEGPDLPTGDFDNDGVVNGDDFVLWQRFFGEDFSLFSNAPPLSHFWNLADWEADFGNAFPAAQLPAHHTVSEPTSFL